MRSNIFTKSLSLFLLLTGFAFGANAQFVNCNVFLQGNYVEVGININGAFGSSEAAPSGYHQRGGVTMKNTCTTGCSGTAGLGFVADPAKDGWTVGSPAYFGDYFLPGSPQEGWSLEDNNAQGNAWNQSAGCGSGVLFSGANTITGTNVSQMFNGYQSIGVWQGINRDSIAITQTTEIDTGNVFFTVSITLKNTSAFTRNNVYYMRTVDPDQEVTINSDYTTINNIDYQLPDSLNATLVSATGEHFASAYLGLGTLDCRAKCFWINSGLAPTVNCDSLYLGSSTVHYSGKDTADAGMGIVFRLGNMAPGDSVKFAYAYILRQADITKAFQSTLPNWTATGDTSAGIHVVGDTANVCVSTMTTVSITNPGDYNWTWISLTGQTLSTTLGPSTGVMTDSTLIRLEAIGTGSCSGINDTLYLNLMPSKPLPNTPTAGSNSPVCQGSAINLTSSTLTAGSTFSWTGPNTFSSGLQNPTIASALLASAGVYTVHALHAGCYSDTAALVTVVVNPIPAPITGSPAICLGQTTTLTDASTLATWSSANTSVATIGSTTGLVTSVSAGTTIISYTYTATGCAATFNETVNPLPLPITGVTTVCVASQVQMSDATAGGTWSSSSVGVANINSGTGIITGFGVGTATITYKLSTGCIATTQVTVNPAVQPILGANSVCVGSSTTLTDASGGGTWQSTNVAVTTIGSLSGIATGVSSGTAVITYRLSAGCYTNKSFTVNPIPVAITGVFNVCAGSSTTLNDATLGGSWSSSNVGVATIGSATGTVTGVSAGTTNITYMIGNGCIATANFTVNVTPVAIVGPSSVCQTFNITLTDATPGGTWSSTAAGVATIGSLTGILNGVGIGTTTISYTMPTGCSNSTVITVNPTPVPISPAGAAICVGNSTTYTDATIGGVWTSSNATIATVGSLAGDVTGVAAGSATITYSIGTCSAWAGVTVNANPAAINPAGPLNLCVAASTTLTDPSPGGTWTSNSTSTATVGSSTGLVNGVAVGVANISYTNAAGCSVFKTLTVNPTPVAIVPSSTTVCVNSTTTLTDATSGGVWNSSNDLVATAGSSTGIITGVASGSTTITYAIGNCYAFATVTVNANPLPINPIGSVSVCEGATTTLTDASPGGVWTSSSIANATVGSLSGVVSGILNGVVTISYTNVAGCSALKTVTVNPTPVAIVPSSVRVCVSSTTTMTDATGGGLWSSSNNLVATAGSSTGIITGIASGSATITYAIGNCYAFATVTVNANPLPINPAGPVSVCEGSTTSLTDASPGGVWTSGSIANATIGSLTGIVTGISAGAITISYTNVSGCSALKTITVNTTPVAIVPGSVNVCVSSTTSMTNATIGGIWSSSNDLVATAGSTTGIITGIATGSATITYALGSCIALGTVTVNANPLAINPAGGVGVCEGATTTLTDPSPGGTWSSSSVANATVGATTGVVSGILAGVVTISYTNAAGCSALKTVTVNITPAAITPASLLVCVGLSLPASDVIAGGTWASTNPSVATIGLTTGMVTGIAIGTTTITYAIGSCLKTSSVVVNPAPVAGSITGPTSICAGFPTAFTDASPGGVWSSSNIAIATVGSLTGSVTGLVAGTAIISYSVTNSCGTVSATYPITVVASPGAGTITGLSLICAGTFTTLTDAAPGGVWSSSNSTATISAGGTLTGISPGLDTIRYTVTNICGTAVATKTVNIGPFLTAGTISGAASVCVGSAITLTDPAPGGVWSASNASATVVGGVVTGVSAGIDTISYTVTSSCGSISATKTVTINALPNAGTISGLSIICAGGSTTYTNTVSGGAWSSSNATMTISALGLANAISAGTDTIKYTVTNACGTAVASYSVSIGAFLSAGTITGGSSVCQGANLTLSDATPGGVWTSGSANATVSGGIVTGVSGGTATISYTVSSACGSASATKVIIINPLPSPAAISGPFALCIGTSSLYTDATSGGVWSVTNSNATINSGGLLTPLLSGFDTVRYSVTNGCGTTTVSQIIAMGVTTPISPITGPSSVCIGASVPMADLVGGGAWTSANPTVATIGATSGMVTGISAGSAVITYTVTSSCGTATATKTISVGAFPTVLGISGPASVCVGSFISLSDASTAGVWSSSNANATVSLTGVVTGVSVGVDTISYTLTNGCGSSSATQIITINPALTVAPIVGASNICVGTAIPYTDAIPSGVWSSSNDAIAIAGSATGLVTGTGAGTALISYTLTGSCGTTVINKLITVDATAFAGAITGPTAVCFGASITLGATIPGGTWTSSNTTIATIGATTGILNGIIPAGVLISYTVTNACGTTSATRVITVNSFPSVGIIAGPTTVCQGANITLTNTIAGGTWSASNTNASVGSLTGIVTGLAGGTDVISYIDDNACGTVSVNTTITINPLPTTGVISGPDSLCMGTTITLTDPLPGGVWSAGNTNASVSGGVVTGLSGGTVPISYSFTNSCGTNSAIKILRVIAMADAGTITGPGSVCVGATITLVNPAPGGTWLTSNANAIVAGPGLIRGAIPGIDSIFYAVTNYCGTEVSHLIVNINPIPVLTPIAGPTSQCIGSVITLTESVGGGTWYSSNSAIADIGSSTGIVTGIAAGAANLTYSVTNSFGCSNSAIHTDTVYTTLSVPAITGSSSVCTGSSITLADAMAGGTWTSGNPTIATVNAVTGLLNGLSAGTVTISYSVSSSCGSVTVTKDIVVNLFPTLPAITGPASVCQGANITLSNAVAGGVWSSTSTAIATIGSLTGIVTGIFPGGDIISYTLTNACGTAATTTIINVNPLPNPGSISGPSTVCIGSAITLVDAASGGVWSAGNTNASVSTGGIVSGLSAGTDPISYTVTNGCGSASAVQTITIVPIPVAGTIIGSTNVCVGATITLTDAATGGVWSSTNANATVTAGIVTGVTAGTDTIVYTVTNACGTASTSLEITINPLPFVAGITGPTSVCIGSPITLADATTGGFWSATNSSASVAGGVVTGASIGIDTIMYSISNMCGTVVATHTVTVSATADAGTITGASNVCSGTPLILTDLVAGGTWSASNATATVAGGVVIAISNGIDTISYTVTNACGTATATKVITVTLSPTGGAVVGPASVCKGSTGTFTDVAGTTGGVWSVTNTNATITAGGILTGVNTGTDTVKYTVSNTCGIATATKLVTINTVPNAGTINGLSIGCAGNTIALSDAAGGGVWTSSNASLASVASSGVVTLFAAGTVTISYTITNSCGATSATHPIAIKAATDCSGGGGTGVNQVTTNDGDELKVYPNPNNGSFNMNLISGINEPVEVTITNVIGEKISQFTTTTNMLTDIILNKVPGIYILSANTIHGRFVAKITVE